MGSNRKEITMRAARDTARLDPAIVRNLGSVAKKAFAASLVLAGALLSQSAGAEERLIQGVDAVRACSGDFEKLCSGIEPGSGRIKACVQGKVSELSAPCKEALAVFIASGETTDNTYERCGCDDACIERLNAKSSEGQGLIPNR
jgi:hypothetical protein